MPRTSSVRPPRQSPWVGQDRYEPNKALRRLQKCDATRLHRSSSYATRSAFSSRDSKLTWPSGTCCAATWSGCRLAKRWRARWTAAAYTGRDRGCRQQSGTSPSITRRRLLDRHTALVLRLGRGGGANRRPAARPGRQHDHRRGTRRTRRCNSAEPRFDPERPMPLEAVAAFGATGDLYPGRPASRRRRPRLTPASAKNRPLRGRSGRA